MRKSLSMLLSVVAGIAIASGTAFAAEGAQSQNKEPRKHKVVAGESLSTVAEKYQLESWRPLWNANTSLTNPDQLNVDEELVVPEGPTTDRPLPAGYGEPVASAAVSAAPASGYRTAPKRAAVTRPLTGDLASRVRMKESGGNYATNTGNGYYGAYQYDVGTWGGYGGYRYASDAPPAVQDAKFAETYAQRGCSPWPNTCN